MYHVFIYLFIYFFFLSFFEQFLFFIPSLIFILFSALQAYRSALPETTPTLLLSQAPPVQVSEQTSTPLNEPTLFDLIASISTLSDLLPELLYYSSHHFPHILSQQLIFILFFLIVTKFVLIFNLFHYFKFLIFISEFNHDLSQCNRGEIIILTTMK